TREGRNPRGLEWTFGLLRPLILESVSRAGMTLSITSRRAMSVPSFALSSRPPGRLARSTAVTRRRTVPCALPAAPPRPPLHEEPREGARRPRRGKPLRGELPSRPHATGPRRDASDGAYRERLESSTRATGPRRRRVSRMCDLAPRDEARRRSR